MKAAFVSVLLCGCAGATEATGWAHDDPNRPMIVAVGPSEASTVEEAARTCGLQNQRRISRSGLEWIVMRDVPARESETSEGVACLARWAMAHPHIRVMFYGKAESDSPRQ